MLSAAISGLRNAFTHTAKSGDVIEVIDRLEADDERRVAVLFEDDRGRERGFQAVRGLEANDAPEAAQRRPAGGRLHVVVERVQKTLHGQRCAQPLNHAPLDSGEGRQRRRAT